MGFICGQADRAAGCSSVLLPPRWSKPWFTFGVKSGSKAQTKTRVCGWAGQHAVKAVLLGGVEAPLEGRAARVADLVICASDVLFAKPRG